MFLDLAGVFAIAFVVSLVACRVIIDRGPSDLPDEPRKAHSAPTPTSGGLGIGVGYAAGMIALSLASLEWRHQVSDRGEVLLWTAALFGYPLLIVGFIDDARRLNAELKFVLYAALAVAAAWLGGVVDELPFGGYVLALPFWLAMLGTALWMFTLVNVVNFMDGSNGLAIGSVGVGLLSLAVLAVLHQIPSGAAITLCTAGALAGFLVWNFPSGRLFAGDAGALFAGAMAAFAALILIERAGVSPFVPAIMFMPLLADALLTLWFRITHKRPLLVGHTEHVYQLAILSGWSHVRIALAYWAAMAACGVIGIAVARDPTGNGPWIALLLLAGLAVLIDRSTRRWARKRGLLGA